MQLNYCLILAQQLFNMKKYILSLACAFSLFSLIANNAEYELILKSGTSVPTELNKSSILKDVYQNAQKDGYAIVQFFNVPNPSEKNLLRQNGIELLEYLPLNAYLAYSFAPSEETVESLNIRAIVAFDQVKKSNPELYADLFPNYIIREGNKIALMVDKQINKTISELESDLVNAGAQITERSTNNEYLQIEIDQSDWKSILDLATVKYVDYSPAPPEKEDTRGRSLHRGNMLDSDHPLGPKYDGSGVSVAIADDGLIGPHIDTKGRVTQFTNTDRGTHGDMTTGITMGAGNLDPRYRGMATDAYLYYYDIGGYPHVSNAVSNLNNRGVVVTSTSYSEGCNTGYTTTTRQVDQQTRQNPELLHVFSAGNSANSNCGYGAGNIWGTITGGRKQGKAVIATGNLEYTGALTFSSSRGPAADGRIKPDICANGTNQISTDPNNTYAPGGGTSAAAPGIAGLALQMIDGYRQINGGQTPESGLVKSAMLNTARDLGNPGPDFFFGWGRVNAHRAFKLLEENRYLRDTITQGVTQSQTITINDSLSELRFMVYWTDFEASTNAARDLVNNLNIKVFTPTGDSLLPWVLDPTPNTTNLSRNAVRAVDNRNNMEQVTLSNPPRGTYTIKVSGFAVPQGPQQYFLLWETRPNEIEVTYPSGGEPFVPGETETIRWDAVGNSGTFRVQFSTDSGATWSTIANSVNGSRRYVNWNVPNTTTGDAMVRVSRSGVIGTSELPFTISRVPGLTVQYTCPDSIRLLWTNTPSANEYEISMLGATHMDSIGRSTTNTFDIYNLNLSDDNWVAVKALNDSLRIDGRRSRAILIPKTVNNCPLDYDFGITQINEPSSGSISSCSFDKMPIRVTITNAGDSVLSNIPVRMWANNVLYRDTVPGPINPGAFQFFRFKDSIALAGQTTINLGFANGLLTDQNETNDSISTQVNVIGTQTFTVPYSNDFETFMNCATTNNCGGTTCNLNGGWVNLANGVDDDYDMRVDFGGTPSNGTGPSVDHNPGTSTGKYLYSEASGSCSNRVSHVLSPCFDLTGTINPEMSFWYHMNGTNMGFMRLDILVDGTWQNNRITPLFGNQGNQWLEQKLNLSPYINKKITVRFRITTGSSWQSDLAIDDFSIRDLSTGIQDEKMNAFGLYPNPNDGQFTIQFGDQRARTIQVYDIRGQLVENVTVSAQRTDLDLSHLNKGMYILSIDGGLQQERLIIH